MMVMRMDMLWNWILLLTMVALVVDVWIRGGKDYNGWRRRDNDD